MKLLYKDDAGSVTNETAKIKWSVPLQHINWWSVNVFSCNIDFLFFCCFSYTI